MGSWRKIGYRRAVKLIGNPRICTICELIFPKELKKPMPSNHQHLEQPTIDHIIPRSKGGTDDATNLRWVCFKCNMDRGDSDKLS